MTNEEVFKGVVGNLDEPGQPGQAAVEISEATKAMLHNLTNGALAGDRTRVSGGSIAGKKANQSVPR